MAKKTLKERFIVYFTANGYTEIDSRNKYVMFLAPFKGKDDLLHSRYIFLGNNGAVRVAIDKKSVSYSFSKTELFKVKLEQWEANLNC